MKKQDKSVLNPSALFAKMLQPVSGSGSDSDYLLTKLEQNKCLLGEYYYLFIFMHRSGCRVSEALNITLLDISPNFSVLIRGLKNSEDRFCFVPECTPHFAKSKRRGINPFYRLNRFTAYRHMKRIGLMKLKKGRSRMAVTHIFRDNYSRDIRNVTSNELHLAKALGHKNIKNSEFYGKD